MRFTNITAFAAACCLAIPVAAFAQSAEDESTHQIAGEEEPSAPTLNFRTGDVELPNKIATLRLGSRFRYLDPENYKRVAGWLASRWENEDPHTLGRPRRRFYRITPLGQEQSRNEAARQAQIFGDLAWSR